MKYAAGFTVPSSVSWQPDMSVKRVNYIHCLVQLLCQCTFLSHLNTENFSTIIINLLTEIETVEGAGTSANTAVSSGLRAKKALVVTIPPEKKNASKKE